MMAESKTNSTKYGDEGNKKAPTAAEAMFFFAIVKHTKNKADIDWDGVATEQGFKNADVAKVRFGQVKRKLGITSDAASGPKKAPALSKVKKSSKPTTGRAGGRTAPKGRKGNIKKEESDDTKDESSESKEELSSPVKTEELDAEAQLQADMDAMINTEPF